MSTIPSPIVLTEEEARAQWEADRRNSIGGSDVYELLNQAQYGRGCRRALAYRKLGQEPDFPEYDQEDAALFRRGHILEDIAGMLYSEQTGRVLRRPPMKYGFPVPRHHRQYPWATVSTDRLIRSTSLDHGNHGTTGDLEIKTRDKGPWLRVKREGPFAGDELQMQWSMWITGHKWAALATLGVFGGLPLIHFDRERNVELQEVFAREGESFADVVWGKGELPAPAFPSTDQRCKVCVYRMSCRGEQIDQAEAQALKQVKASAKKLVQIDDPELSVTLAEMDLLKAEAKAIDDAMEVAKEEVTFRLDGIDAALVKGYGRVTRIQVGEREVHYVADGYSYLRRYPDK